MCDNDDVWCISCCVLLLFAPIKPTDSVVVGKDEPLSGDMFDRLRPLLLGFLRASHVTTRRLTRLVVSVVMCNAGVLLLCRLNVVMWCSVRGLAVCVAQLLQI